MAFSSQNERLRQMLLQAFGYPELVDLFISEVTEVISSEIADDAVTTPKINNLAVTTGKINDLAVTTGKIANLAVTTGKLEGASAVTAYLNAMVGDSGAGGTKGLVPAPAIGDAAASKFLKADGTWAVSGGGITIGDAITGGAANRILFEGAGNTLNQSASLTFDGTNLSLGTGGLFAIQAGGTSVMQIRAAGNQYVAFDAPILDNVGTLSFGTDTTGTNTYPFLRSYFGTGGVQIGAVWNAIRTNPNYELDIRGGAGNSTIQLSNTASGSDSTDGVLLDFDGTNLKITNQESGKLLVSGALGVGNSAAATSPGTVTKKIEIFDAAGASLGFVAVYDAIT